MSFLLRAALVIGALSYFAAMRERGETPTAGPGLGALVAAVEDASEPTARLDTLSAAWNAMPPEVRARIGREAMADLGLRAAPASRDTLDEADRRAPWRGADTR